MAFSYHSLSHSISFLLPLLCICTASSELDVKASGLVNQICPQTRNPTLCFQMLGLSQIVSLRDLGQKSVELAQKAGILASDAIQLLISAGKDPLLINRYSSCADNYARASGDAAESSLLLKSNSYENLPSIIAAALEEAEDCDKNFVKPPSQPLLLKELTKNFQDVTSIVLVISKLLAGEKL